MTASQYGAQAKRTNLPRPSLNLPGTKEDWNVLQVVLQPIECCVSNVPECSWHMSKQLGCVQWAPYG